MQEVFDGSKVVVVNDTFDRSWQKVGVAIERAGLAVENSDRASGVYFLRSDKAESGLLDKVQFWKEDAGNIRYRVNVRDGGRACEVSVTDQDGASDDASSRMIEEIFRNIGQ
jgi:outer membrane protein assembly factor BamC